MSVSRPRVPFPILRELCESIGAKTEDVVEIVITPHDVTVRSRIVANIEHGDTPPPLPATTGVPERKP